MIHDVTEQDGLVKWDFLNKPYQAAVQAAPYSSAEGMIYFVRGGIEPVTFNPFLQVNFDPETKGMYEAISLQYFANKGIDVYDKEGKMLPEFIDTQDQGFWISSGLLGMLGKDESDKDFFAAERMSRLTMLLYMAAGVAVYLGAVQLITLIGENFG